MMNVRFTTMSDATLISKLAHEIWPVTYAGVISKEQIEFMLQQSYTISAIENQIKNGHLFFILEKDALPQGFACLTELNATTFKLEKLYVHQNLHGQGAGRFLITAVEDYSKFKGASQLLLNVNRNNKAKLFYDKMGYKILEAVDIPYYGYVLNDYVMAKTLF